MTTNTDKSPLLNLKPKTMKQNLLGWFLAFMSSLIFTLNHAVIQYNFVNATDLTFVRSVLQTLIIGFICYIKSYSLIPRPKEKKTKVRCLIVLQGICGGIMLIAGYGCLVLMPLGDASTLFISAPAFTIFFAWLCLKESLSSIRVGLVLLLISGTILVVQPPLIFGLKDTYSIDYYIGVGLAITAALADGVINVSINLCSDIESLVLLWWSGLCGLLLSLLSFSIDPNARILTSDITTILPSDWIIIFVCSMVGFCGYFCMTKSLQLIDPTVVAFLRHWKS